MADTDCGVWSVRPRAHRPCPVSRAIPVARTCCPFHLLSSFSPDGMEKKSSGMQLHEGKLRQMYRTDRQRPLSGQLVQCVRHCLSCSGSGLGSYCGERGAVTSSRERRCGGGGSGRHGTASGDCRQGGLTGGGIGQRGRGLAGLRQSRSAQTAVGRRRQGVSKVGQASRAEGAGV